MSSVTFETRIGVESNAVFVMACFDPDGDVELLTVAPLVENKVQMDISGYLDQATLMRLETEAKRASDEQAEQAKTDAAIDRYETERLYGRAA